MQCNNASGLAGGRNMVIGFEIQTRVDSRDNCGPVEDREKHHCVKPLSRAGHARAASCEL